MRGSSGQPAGEPRENFANWFSTCDLDQQSAKCSGTGRNSCVSNVLFQSQSSACVGIERSRKSLAANGLGESTQRIERLGAGKALGK